jgi:serine/threonine protein kinase
LSAFKQGIPSELAAFIISEICKGLDYSHNKCDDMTGEPLHIVHRDISPQNMLISFRGEVKISDFGISKARSEPSLTQVGVIKGKMSYLSPEQALGEPVDARADIYALGLVFYELLTGKRVYQFESDIEAIRSIPKMIIKPPIQEQPNTPQELNDVVMKCLEKDKNLRFQSALELFKKLVKLKKQHKIVVDGSNLMDFMKKHFEENIHFSNSN